MPEFIEDNIPRIEISIGQVYTDVFGSKYQVVDVTEDHFDIRVIKSMFPSLPSRPGIYRYKWNEPFGLILERTN